jgi:CSLREA domain-containing protein
MSQLGGERRSLHASPLRRGNAMLQIARFGLLVGAPTAMISVRGADVDPRSPLRDVRSATPLRSPARIVGHAIFLMVCLILFAAAQAATFTVNSAADVPDVALGDGKCETVVDSQVACTLRAAVQEANALAGQDTILLQANTTYLLTRVGIEEASLFGSLDISDSVDIVGAGPASTIVDGNGAVTNDRVFLVGTCNTNGCAPESIAVNMSGITIRHGHSAGSGGGLASSLVVGDKTAVTLTNCRIEDNTSDLTGGGIYAGAAITLTGSVAAGNTAVQGGGAFFALHTVITDSTFTGNTSGGNGGGIVLWNYGRINRSTISGNRAHAEGGGIYSVTSASPSPYQLFIVNSTISGNGSDGVGGGLRNTNGGANLLNVTIAGNTANTDRSGSDGVGGGVANAGNATLTLVNSIVANNSALVSNSLFTVLNDCTGTIASLGFNIVRYATCTVAGNYSTDAVQFGPFGYNGGPTQTLPLLAGTGGIDAGDPAGCTDDIGAGLDTDQRGLPRPVGAACDLGAYEVQPDVIFENGFDG